MLPNEQMVDNNNIQVALFPLEGFSISQPWWGTYSHDQSRYYATDFLAKDSQGVLQTRAPCYAPSILNFYILIEVRQWLYGKVQVKYILLTARLII